MPVHVYAGNLNYRMTEGSLRELFEQYGEVTSVKIVKDRVSGRSKGFGFVEMVNPEEAESAIQGLDGTEVDGRSIRVNKAKPRI
ncbi:MAG: RNA recognition motif domain-containing protein [Acidobacteriota bacterium]